MQLREHSFLGTTQSLCPHCLNLVPAKIVSRAGRVYFRKRCPVHGVREDFVCSDVRWYDRMEFSLPGKVPRQFGVEPARGCPFDCGLCSEHEQHTCIGLLEITGACNLRCPMCYAESGPGGKHLSVEACRRAIDRLVEVEGRPEVLQLSGGEPTVHPRFEEILVYACEQPIDIVMVNTNGIRLARDPRLVEALARLAHRVEVYLQLDGLDDQSHAPLRGEPVIEDKLRAIDVLGEAGLRTTLVATLESGLNENQIGPLVRFGSQRPWITGVSFQPATYVGRHVQPAELERRITFPDVVREVARQADGVWREDDFLPLPCAHPNGHTLAYAYRSKGEQIPLTRLINIADHLELLAGGITFTRGRARELIEEYLAREACGPAGCGVVSPRVGRPILAKSGRADGDTGGRTDPGDAKSGGREDIAPELRDVAEEFFSRALAEDLAPADVFRITITSFMDAYNFDVRQLIKSCVHHVLPTGHLIPFSAYNLFYRDGRLPLPPLKPGSLKDVEVVALEAW